MYASANLQFSCFPKASSVTSLVMSRLLRRHFISMLFIGSAVGRTLAGCSTDAAPSGTGSCEMVTPQTFRFSATADSGWFTEAYSSAITPDVANGWQGLAIKLKSRSGPFAPGTFDLSKEAADTDMCKHCVYVTYDGSGDNFQLAIASGGTLEIREVDVSTGKLDATLRGVTFRHLNQVALHAFKTPANDQRCFYIEEATVDTRASTGRTCLEAGDCANAKLEVCDPLSRTCVPAACSANEATCSGGGICQIQDPFFGTGACYQRCAPFGPTQCLAGQDCVPVDYVGKEGVCKQQGPEAPKPISTPEPGRSCTPHQVATGCAAGDVCTTHAVYWHYDHCYRQCDYFASSPGCASGRCWLKLHTKKEIEVTYLCGSGDCHFGGICAETDNAVALDASCDANANPGDDCFGDEQRSGVCMPGTDGLRCRRFCRVGASDCNSSLRCEPMVLGTGNATRSFTKQGLGYCTK
jgi:hypothetical protein